MINHPAVREAVQTCEACPDQWEGWLTDGRAFYLRYRFGKAHLAIGADRAAVDGVSGPGMAPPGTVWAYVQHGDDLSGMFTSDEDRNRVFGYLFDLLEGGPAANYKNH